MGSCGAFYARLEGARNTPRALETIYPPSICESRWENFVEVATQSHLVDGSLVGGNVSSLATEAFCNIDQACSHCSSYPSYISENKHRWCAFVVLLDLPSPTVALYFCRFTPQKQYFSTREIELLRLLRATLLQTIKAVIFREESQNLQRILNSLPGHAEPLAMFSEDGELVFKNEAFDQAVGQNNDASLPTCLASITTAKSGKSGHDCSLSRLGRRLYEVNLTPVNTSANGNADLYLLRFTRVTDKNKQTIRQLDKAGLTPRELQVAALIHRGISTNNISGKLNLSYHTIRNHIKHIYSKIGVSTRSQMLMWGE